jgi:hypothetical protein
MTNLSGLGFEVYRLPISIGNQPTASAVGSMEAILTHQATVSTVASKAGFYDYTAMKHIYPGSMPGILLHLWVIEKVWGVTSDLGT